MQKHPIPNLHQRHQPNSPITLPLYHEKAASKEKLEQKPPQLDAILFS